MKKITIDEESLNTLTDVYGIDNQYIKALEEMAELSKEILKHLQHRDRKEQITDEMSDVLITLENVRLMLDINIEDINNNIKFKLNRAILNIKKEKL